MTELRMCDFCGTTTMPDKVFDYLICDPKGIAQDKGDLCRTCYEKLQALIDGLRKAKVHG